MTRPAIHVTPRARQRILEASTWWRENRLDAPDLFEDEFTEALALLADSPDIGIRHHDRGIPDLRRWLLRRTKYHIYYTYDPGTQKLWILSLWSSSRGKPPLL